MKKTNASIHSLKHINAYLCLHGKDVSKGAIAKFLSILQSDIKSGKITKAKDKFHKEVDRIQRSLVGMSNAMWKGEVAKVEIEPLRRKHYEAVLEGQGLGNAVPMVIAGAVTGLTTYHITKMFAKGLNGVDNNDLEPTYSQFKHKPKEAIKFLKKKKKGQCVAALYRKDIGDIDIVWGEHNDKTNDGYGLLHIIKKHEHEIKQLGFSVEDFIPIVIQFGEFNEKRSIDGKKVFESKYFRFVIQTTYKGKNKVWLLSAFDLRRKVNKNTLGTIKTVHADCLTLETLLQKTSGLYTKLCKKPNKPKNTRLKVTKTSPIKRIALQDCGSH